LFRLLAPADVTDNANGAEPVGLEVGRDRYFDREFMAGFVWSRSSTTRAARSSTHAMAPPRNSTLLIICASVL